MKCPVCDSDMHQNDVKVGESFDCHDCGYSYDSYDRREWLSEQKKKMSSLLEQLGKWETEH